MDFKNLSEKETYFRQYTDKYLIREDGVVYSSVFDETLKPWTSKDIKPTDEFINIPYEIWDILNYENSGMTTGAYLAVQSYRYMVTKNEAALQQAQRCFRGIQYIYNVGKQKEVGYFPKIYGGVYSEETSTDQYLYAMKGMMAYMGIAPETDVQAIKSMIPQMVDFWVKRKYRRTYFGIKNMLWPLGRFPSLLLMAHKVSGHKKYLDEFKRLNQEEKIYLSPTDSPIYGRLNADRPVECSDYEKRKDNMFLLRDIGECATMDIMGLDECLQYSNAYKEYWLKSMKQAWYEGQLALTDNGLARVVFCYDPDTKRVTTPDPEYISESGEMDWSFMRWAGGHLCSRSTLLARAGINVAKWLPDENASQVAIKILADISPSNMKENIDPDGQQMLDKHRYRCHDVSVDAIVNWLWAYWQGRHEGAINPES